MEVVEALTVRHSLTAVIFPPCACGMYHAQDTKGKDGCATYRPVSSKNCPDGVPVEVVFEQLVIKENV